MFKVIVLVALFAVVYGLPASDLNSDVEAPVKAVTGELESKNEKDDLKGAESGWGWQKWGNSYPTYKVHYYPVHYHQVKYHPVYYYTGHQSSHGHGHGHGHGSYGHGSYGHGSYGHGSYGHGSSGHGGWW